MPRSPDKSLVNLVMEPAEVEVLDEFQHEHRFKSRAAAMKYLMASRLAQLPKPTREEREQFRTLIAS